VLVWRLECPTTDKYFFFVLQAFAWHTRHTWSSVLMIQKVVLLIFLDGELADFYIWTYFGRTNVILFIWTITTRITNKSYKSKLYKSTLCSCGWYFISCEPPNVNKKGSATSQLIYYFGISMWIKIYIPRDYTVNYTHTYAYKHRLYINIYVCVRVWKKTDLWPLENGPQLIPVGSCSLNNVYITRGGYKTHSLPIVPNAKTYININAWWKHLRTWV
jgi:hypothetical protein